MVYKTKILALLLLLSIGLTSCLNNNLVLRPLEEWNVIITQKGTMVGDKETKEDGAWFSNTYIQDVMKVKIEK